MMGFVPQPIYELWSSYRAHAGMAVVPPWLDTPAVHGYLLGRDATTAADRRKAGAQYVALVAAGKGIKLWEDALSQQIFLGDAEFVERMQAMVGADRVRSTDIPRPQRRKPPTSIDQYLQHKQDREGGTTFPFSHRKIGGAFRV